MTAPGQGLSILQVNTADTGGGAYRIGEDLHQAYLDLGHDPWLAVRIKGTDDPRVLVIPNDAARDLWARVWVRVEHLLARPLRGYFGWTWLARSLQTAGQPARSLRILRGWEDFDFPGTRELLDLPPRRPEVVHAHNLHGDYFDLRALPQLSAAVPFFLTLHDAWLLSGHCAHSIDCERWLSGCGNCPDLSLYPMLLRDNTAANWQRKAGIYRSSRLFVATPCRWLMDRVDRSMLAEGVAERRVIPNGVDLGRFRPKDQAVARRSLDLPEDAHIVLFSAREIKANPWKDWPTIREAIAIASERLPNKRLVLLGLGEARGVESAGRADIRFLPFRADRNSVVEYYAAADVYLHAARADTFPNTVIEALACGIPVVATAVGGIPEQVTDFRHGPAGAGTGVLSPGGDAAELAAGLICLVEDSELRRRLGQNARDDARDRFDIQRQANDYLAWYDEVLARISSGDVPLPVAQ
jgi:glycosyltransferase involved in cell wall biosynthesis